MRPIEASLRRAALLVIAASVLGPGVLFVDAALRRPAPWSGPEAFLASHHWLQAVPPLLGFPLLLGFVLFVAAAKRLDAARGGRVDQAPVLLLTAIYGALVAFNYVANACWVGQAGPAELPGVTVLAMANPRSLCWAIEMFAYAILGVVTWLVAPTFREERAVALLLRVNGVVSVASAAYTLVDLAWVQTPVGLAFYAAWNLLLIALMALVLARFRAPGADAPPAAVGAAGRNAAP
jgi:hypothetical protein